MQYCMIESIHGIRYIQGIREGVVHSIRRGQKCYSNDVVIDPVLKDEQEFCRVEKRALSKKRRINKIQNGMEYLRSCDQFRMGGAVSNRQR